MSNCVDWAVKLQIKIADMQADMGFLCLCIPQKSPFFHCLAHL